MEANSEGGNSSSRAVGVYSEDGNMSRTSSNNTTPLFTRSPTTETLASSTSTLLPTFGSTKVFPYSSSYLVTEITEKQKEQQKVPPHTNYIWNKSTNSYIKHPSFWMVLLHCIKLVFSLTCLGLLAFIPVFGWAFFDSFYITPTSPFIQPCSYCADISEGASVFTIAALPYLTLMGVYGWEKVCHYITYLLYE